MIWGAIADIAGTTLLVLGCLLTLLAAVGLLRLDGLFARMHVATKPQILGLICMTGGLALILRNPRATATLALVVVLQLVTTPIAAHLLGRGAFRSKRVETGRLVVDEYSEDIKRVQDTADDDEPSA